ncbi:redoxin domain-containing protein [Flavobacterium pectinovorum]|uniref:TlpA family protein disulfide reductase n=1 Tax=Flavobacterium pectinovorum TaxID=29533 RepID=UPI00265FD7F5|nr:redoxin domain-containing protein [Flavobacterium pectinovorum]WKL46271.1 redoxin domain-containing protein [Flavobacterium pectinovorum]
MKTSLKSILILLFIGILVFLGYQIRSKINHKNEVAQNIKTIPAFTYQNLNGNIFTNEDLKKEIAIIFIYFNTECEYCDHEAQMIEENITKLKKIQLVFVSFEKPEQIKKFAQKHQLTTYDNVYFLCDNKVTFAATFDVNSLPCLVLYDKNQNLIEKIKGQTSIKILLNKMNAQ